MASGMLIEEYYNINIVSVYRPPRGKIQQGNWKVLFQLCDHSNCLVAGDSNLHNRSWDCAHNDRESESFLELIEDFNLIILNE